MLGHLKQALSASIGKKAWMAISGLLLVGFLTTHLLGNLLLFAGDEGEAFNAYAAAISNNPLLPVAELLLATLFLAHLALGVRVSMENRASRELRYQRLANHGGRTTGSGTMLISGIVVLLFLIIHLIDFRLDPSTHQDMASAVTSKLGGAKGAFTYGVGVAALGLHLSHAIGSAFQTLGVNHPKYDSALQIAGRGLGVILALGFLAFPVLLFLSNGESR
jgi:succinate dehydrogenase / fumarate reductase cytochrome b subunit